MKRILIALAVVLLITASAYAAGGKNHGDKGKGSVHQVVGP